MTDQPHPNPAEERPPNPKRLLSEPTRREVADRNLRRFSRSLARIRFGGKGNPYVIRQKLDDWLEYRKRAQDDGTLDEESRL